jgi:hypothetical protein
MCPMRDNVPLTDKQIKYFCSLGCSVECEIFFARYLKRLKVEYQHQMNMEGLDGGQGTIQCCK